MARNSDIYRAAFALIQQHGDDAPREAGGRAEELLAEGRMEERAVWLWITEATRHLLSKKEPADSA